MSHTKAVTLWCDHGRDPETGRMGCVEWTTVEVPTVFEARLTACKRGWALRAGQDFCPRHALPRRHPRLDSNQDPRDQSAV